METIIESFVGMDFGYGVAVLCAIYLALITSFSYVAIGSFVFLIKSLYIQYGSKK